MRRNFPEAEVEQAAGALPRRWESIENGGYGRVNAHWRVELADGRSVFVKHALSEEAADWLRTERRVLESVRASFVPAFHGSYDEDCCTLIVIEDLSAGLTPPPWTSEGRAWLDDALPRLLDAATSAVLDDGTALLHFDVRNDNLFFVEDRVVLVAWNLACVGNGRFDVAFWLPSLRIEGGPQPWEVLPDEPGLAAAVAGFFASSAGLPPPAGAPAVREFQCAQAEVALAWASRELGLKLPT